MNEEPPRVQFMIHCSSSFFQLPIAIRAKPNYATSMTSKFRIFLVLSVFAVLLTWVSSASACPNCKEAIAAEGGEDGDGTPQTAVSDLGRAYSISVLFMLGSFLSVLIGFSSAFYWIYHSHQRTVTSGSRLNEPESLTHGDSSAYDYATSPGH